MMPAIQQTDNETRPYQNRSLEDLDGEQWSMIPGFGDQYMVSSYGRIKSLERTIFLRRRNCSRHQPEKIKSPKLHRWYNKLTNDHVYNLNIELAFEGMRKGITIRRLVYHCFVGPIDLEDYSFNILCKDGDGLNIHCSNLEKTDLTERQARIFRQHRAVSCFSYLDHQKMVEHRKKPGNQRQVSLYHLSGKKLATYSSIAAGAKAVGIKTQLIDSVLKGKTQTTGGAHVWRYGDGPDYIDLPAFFKARRAERSKSLRRTVTQYSHSGERIAIYDGYKAAHKAIGISGSCLSRSIKQFPKSGKGFIWKGGEGPERIIIPAFEKSLNTAG